MGVLKTISSLLLVGVIILTLTCATLGFATQTLLTEKTQLAALTESGLIPGILAMLSSQTNISIPPSIATIVITNNIPRITSYLSDSSPSLDLDLSIPEKEFENIFGALPLCQGTQNPLQNGKLICKPSVPLTLLTKAVEGATSQATNTVETELTTHFTQAKQGLLLLKKITWITFFLALALLAGLIILHHTSWSSAGAWATVALGMTGFLTLAIALLAHSYLLPLLPTTPLYLTTYLTQLLISFLSALKTYSLMILATALLALFGSFYLKSKA